MPRVKNLEEKIGELIVAKIDDQLVTAWEFPISKHFQTLGESGFNLIVDILEWRYQNWILQFADQLTQHPDGGFSVLVLINAYFDMVAQLQGHPRGSIEKGIELVFPELKCETDIKRELKNNLRNAIAHMGITTGIILLEGFSDPIVWGPFRAVDPAIVISPRLMLLRIKSHFDNYLASLRDTSPEYSKLRRDFLNRMTREA